MRNVKPRLCCTVLVAVVALLCMHTLAAAQAVWPNEPAGSTLITDWSFNTISGPLPGPRWRNNGGSLIVSDVTAPLSPTNVLKFPYPVGFLSGYAPDTVYFPLNNLSEIYFGYWWKASNPWHAHSSFINKIAFQFTDLTGGQLIQIMFGNGGSEPYRVMSSLEFNGVDNSHLGNGYGDAPGTWQLFGNASEGKVTLGHWHRIEVYIKKGTSSSSKNGIIRWWVDGILVGNFSNVNYPTPPFIEYQFSPTWGGAVGARKSEEDYYYYDHVRISQPSGVADVTPPDAPTNLMVN